MAWAAAIGGTVVDSRRKFPHRSLNNHRLMTIPSRDTCYWGAADLAQGIPSDDPQA